MCSTSVPGMSAIVPKAIVISRNFGVVQLLNTRDISTTITDLMLSVDQSTLR